MYLKIFKMFQYLTKLLFFNNMREFSGKICNFKKIINIKNNIHIIKGDIMNKNIIIAILVVIIIAIVGVSLFAHPQQQSTTADGKENTQIKFISKSNLKNGDIVQFELKDSKGNAIAKQVINITFEENGEKQKYSIITDNNGKGGLALNNEKSGNHEVTITYGGNNKYNGCSAKLNITIENGNTTNTEKVSGNSTASTVKYNEKTTSSNSSSGSSLSEGPGPNLYYDEEFNVWYDDNGIIRGGQSDGKSMWDLVNNQPIVTENGLE